MKRGEIIAIGSELLLGGRLDTNSLFLAEQLASAGVEVRFKSVVGDDEPDIQQALRLAAGRAEVVVLTGGLGPTLDDRTRQAVARATGRTLRRRAEALEGMRRRLAAWGRVPTVAQLRQGLIPRGAEVLPNPVGSAPGFCLTWRGCVIVALPGVPAEAAQMFAVSVMPKLGAGSAAWAGHRGRSGPERIQRRLLQTFGLPESEVDHKLKGLVPSGLGVRLGLLASPLGVTVSLTATDDRRNRRVAGSGYLVDRLLKAVRKRLGPYVYAEGAETMEAVVGRHLAACGLVLAVAESCTGGLIGHRLTQVPGSSQYLDRVAVCYSNRAKREMLGVSEALMRRYGAVSAEVAAAMACGIRARSHTGIGLSVTGVAGPGGGTARKPVGLVYVGLNTQRASSRNVTARGPGTRTGREARVTREFRFHGDRHTIKLRASQAALNLLREWLVATESRAQGRGRP
ncbi:MAG: CinA family nicotinamide mononucleotide deamidase-related protein [Nitrospiraceae bacterium]